MVAAGAAAALFHAASALANPACSGVLDACGCPGESPAVFDGEPAGAVAPVPAGVEVAAAPAVDEACPVLRAAGWVPPAELHAAVARLVASNTPMTGRNRCLITFVVTPEPGVWSALVGVAGRWAVFKSASVNFHQWQMVVVPDVRLPASCRPG